MKGILGKKLGMTQVFDEGRRIPVTVIEAGPCTVLAQRTPDTNGYTALQLGFGQRRPKNVTKPVLGQLKAAERQDSPPERIREIRWDESAEQQNVGDTLEVSQFEQGDYVDVTGMTKGRGFQGVVKRYRFAGQSATHGFDWTRKPGSIGMCEKPARVYRGRKMPGRMGHTRRTVQNLQVVDVRNEDNVLLVKGSVPGANGDYLVIRQALKK
ncbi:MAG: 50S ribosomal protein L3 [Verrucomicrobiota bacterium]